MIHFVTLLACQRETLKLCTYSPYPPVHSQSKTLPIPLYVAANIVMYKIEESSVLSFIIRHANVWESMGKPCSRTHVLYKKPYFLLEVTRESVSVLQVMRESVSCTRNNTDGNKLVIFSGIALYYGGNYLV